MGPFEVNSICPGQESDILSDCIMPSRTGMAPSTLNQHLDSHGSEVLGVPTVRAGVTTVQGASSQMLGCHPSV